MQRRFPSEGGTAVPERKELSPRALEQGWKADLMGQACSSEMLIPQAHL